MARPGFKSRQPDQIPHVRTGHTGSTHLMGADNTLTLNLKSPCAGSYRTRCRVSGRPHTRSKRLIRRWVNWIMSVRYSRSPAPLLRVVSICLSVSLRSLGESCPSDSAPSGSCVGVTVVGIRSHGDGLPESLQRRKLEFELLRQDVAGAERVFCNPTIVVFTSPGERVE
jgi:hypothetical protein